MRTVAMERPADWNPPPKWTPPDAAAAPSVELSYHLRWPPLVRWFEVVAVFAALAGTAGAYHIAFGTGGAAARASVPDATVPPKLETEGHWDGVEPYTCSGTTQVTLAGVRADLPHGTALEVSGDCQLTLRDVEITAWEGATVTDNGRLLIENSSLHTIGATISATGRANVEVTNSRLTSAGEAITATRRARVVLAGGSVSGSPHAVARTARASVEVRDTEIEDLTAL